MSESVLSPDWYRVADLRPRVRSSVQIARHVYRGEPWFVLNDPVGGTNLRVNRIAYELVGRLDGTQTVDEIWQTLMARLGDDAPTQAEVLRIFTSLYDANLLQVEVRPDSAFLFRRHRDRRHKRRLSAVNPLAFRIPLWNPTPLLDRLEPLAGWLFNPLSAALWLMVIVVAGFAAAMHWSELAARSAAHFSNPRNLWLTWLAYPLIKSLHELGHALALRRWGGAVHETGVTLMLLTPVPYVDASASALLPGCRQRAAVAAAGIAVELMLAAFALATWLSVEDGLVRDIALSVMLIGGVSTLLFNGNPLLRFDGYYVLSDLIDIPNLGKRANDHVAYLAQRYLLGLRGARAPQHARGERRWFVGYAISSWLYRLLISCAVALFLADLHPALGAIGVLTAAWSMAVSPGLRIIRFVLGSPLMAANRLRAWPAALALFAAAVGTIFVLPLPASTAAEGIVWLPENAQLRAGTPGFVRTVLAPSGKAIETGTPVLLLDNPELEAEVIKAEAKLQALSVERMQSLVAEPVKAQVVEQDIARTEAELARLRQQVGQLVVRAGASGELVLPRSGDLPGRFLDKGELVGHVLTRDQITVRAVVANEDASLVREQTREVQVRLLESPDAIYQGSVLGQSTTPSNLLPSAALGDRSGGRIVTEPGDPDGLRSVRPFFLVDIGVPAQALERVGARTVVRFEHGHASLADQATRRLRQVFLRHFQAS